MEPNEFDRALEALQVTISAIQGERERGKDYTTAFSELDVMAFRAIVKQLSDIRTDLFEARRFGRGLPNEGVVG